MKLPTEFKIRMQEMLGEEADVFFASYDRPRRYGLRVNTLKIMPEEFAARAPFPVVRIPWIPNGFCYGQDIFPSRHPWYRAGVYYLQEPSAMIPASLLPVQPGDRVLDLCAAPGGKATELGARLQGRGTLVANDLSTTRCRALLRNLELFGVANALVTNESPAALEKYFTGWFDAVLVDAPCSGEGMFRKEEAMAAAWSPEKVQQCAAMQRTILTSAVQMLKNGGYLLYSTCTFSKEENEGSISWLLREFPEMELVPLEHGETFSYGVPEWGDGREELRYCIRIWPHRTAGEGHFAALLRKKAADDTQFFEKRTGKKNRKKRDTGNRGKGGSREEQAAGKVLKEFLEAWYPEADPERLEIRGEKAYLVPELPEDLRGIHFLRNGLYLGECKKNRFEPSQTLAMHLKPKEDRILDYPAEGPLVESFLQGETIPLPPDEKKTEKGWKLVCADGFPLGWGKISNGQVKNKVLCSWRK